MLSINQRKGTREMVYSHSWKLKVCKVSKSLKIWAMPIWAMPRMGSSRIYNNLLVHWIWVWIFNSLNKFENIFCMPSSHAHYIVKVFWGKIDTVLNAEFTDDKLFLSLFKYSCQWCSPTPLNSANFWHFCDI